MKGIIFLLLVAHCYANDELISLCEQTFTFGVSVLAELSNQSRRNFIFSPVSIHESLAILYGGSAYETSAAMKENLFYYESPLEVANGYRMVHAELALLANVYLATEIYIQTKETLNPKFNNLLSNYNALVKTFNYSIQDTVHDINKWIKQQTAGRIQDIVSAENIRPTTQILVASAFSFTGAFEIPFNIKLTSPQRFYVNKELSFDVQMMRGLNKYYYTETLTSQVLTIPYKTKGPKKNRVMLSIALPKKKHAIESFVHSHTLEIFYVHEYPGELTTVEVFLPRFKSAVLYSNLRNTLDKIGLKEIFDDCADFSNVFDKGFNLDYKVTDFVHKAYIEVNEKGTGASSAADIETGPPKEAKGKRMFKKSPDDIPTFMADHPFVILVWQQHGPLLFTGRVDYPEAAPPY